MNEESKELIAMGMKLIKMGCDKTDTCDGCFFHDFCWKQEDTPADWQLPYIVL